MRSPDSGRCMEASHLEPSLSRPWAAPTKAWPIPASGDASTIPVGGGHAPESGRCHGNASTGTGAFAAMGRSYKSVTISMAGDASTIPVGGGHAPESGRWHGNASTGTGAFAAMGRSYKSVTISMAGGASTIPVGGGHAPESGECHGNASTGTIAFAGMARSYRRRCPLQRRVVHHRGDIQGVRPLFVHPAAKPPRAIRPERRAWPAPTEGVARSNGGWCIAGGYTRGPPLVRTPCGQAAAGHQAREAVDAGKRPDRDPYPSRTTSAYRTASARRSYRKVAYRYVPASYPMPSCNIACRSPSDGPTTGAPRT